MWQPAIGRSILTIVFLFAPNLIYGQAAATGTVSGQITDPQGAAVKGTEVRLLDQATNVTRVTSSNEQGRYDFANVAPGTYDLSVDSQGFAVSKITGQKVDIGLALTLNVTLQIGTTATTVEVKASAGAELQTLNSTVGNTITGDSLLMLPNFQRDANALATLQVGVTPSGQVAGVQTDQSSFTLDGGNNSDDMAGSYSAYTTSNGGGSSGVVPTPGGERRRVQSCDQQSDGGLQRGGREPGPDGDEARHEPIPRFALRLLFRE